MPEGDTVHRAARALHRALSGRTVTGFESVFPGLTRIDRDRPIRGRVVKQVTARGQHLLIWFSGDLVLRTHLRMSGAWRLYETDERWTRPRHEMRIVIATDEVEAVAFNVPVAEFVGARDAGRDRVLRDLGPDPLAEDFDVAEAVRRIEARADMQIADALLDQAAMAGIGNIWKSETLFACRLNPFSFVRDLSPEMRKKLVTTTSRLMRASVACTSRLGGRRKVFRRAGQPCRLCGTPIASRKQGPNARSTYWCDRCQPETSAGPASPSPPPPA